MPSALIASSSEILHVKSLGRRIQDVPFDEHGEPELVYGECMYVEKYKDEYCCCDSWNYEEWSFRKEETLEKAK